MKSVYTIYNLNTWVKLLPELFRFQRQLLSYICCQGL